MVYKKIFSLSVISFLLIQSIHTPLLAITLDELEQEFATSPDKSPEDILGNMSDEELLELLKSTGFDEPLSTPTPPSMPKAITAPAPQISKPENKIATASTIPTSSQPLEQITKAISTIESTLTLIEEFLLYSQYIPELPGKIDSWIRQDKIREWQIELTWETLRAKIESLYYKITQLKGRDPVTKEYRHIDTLIKDNTTYNALISLQKKLNRLVPKLRAVDPFKPLSKKNRSDIKEILGSFTETMYTAQLEKKIEAILEKYSTRAAELQGQKEKEAKRALEESKKVRKESKRQEVKETKPASSAGKGKTDKYDVGAYDDYSYYPSYPNSGYYYGGGDYDYQGGGKSPTSAGKKIEPKEASPKETTPSEGIAGKPTPKKQEKEPEKPKVEDEKKVSKDLEKILDAIDNAADSIGELIDETGAGNTKRYIEITSTQKEPNRSMMGSVESATLTMNRARRLLRKIPNSEKDTALRTIKDRLKKTELLDLSDKVSALKPTHSGIIALKNLGESIKALYQKNYSPKHIPLIEETVESFEAEPMRKRPVKPVKK